MSKSDCIEAEGTVVEVLPNTNFKVKLSNGHIITAYLSGKLRTNYIKIILGDTVKIVGTGNGSSYGKSNTAYGIGWTRQILKIWEGRPYPYQVGNNTGTTGFYKAEALQRK